MTIPVRAKTGLGKGLSSNPNCAVVSLHLRGGDRKSAGVGISTTSAGVRGPVTGVASMDIVISDAVYRGEGEG